MLFRWSALLSAAATILFYLTGRLVRLFQLPAAFVVLFLELVLIWAIGCVLCTAFVDPEKPCIKHSPIYRFFTNCIIDSLVQLLRVKLHVTGLEKLPDEQFLLVGNHRSGLDPLLEMGVLRGRRLGFVAKQELFKIPVIGKLMHRCFCIPLDRGSLRDGLKMMQHAAGNIKAQTASIGIYPEGTRSQGSELLPFKSGAFKIAQKAKCPVVVAVIRNSDRIMRRAPFHKTDVYLDIVGVIGAQQAADLKTVELSLTVRTMMERALMGAHAVES